MLVATCINGLTHLYQEQPNLSDYFGDISLPKALFRTYLKESYSFKPFSLRVTQESIVCYFHTFENKLGNKANSHKIFEGELLVIF